MNRNGSLSNLDFMDCGASDSVTADGLDRYTITFSQHTSALPYADWSRACTSMQSVSDATGAIFSTACVL